LSGVSVKWLSVKRGPVEWRVGQVAVGQVSDGEVAFGQVTRIHKTFKKDLILISKIKLILKNPLFDKFFGQK
jgi:hypothetical protein